MSNGLKAFVDYINRMKGPLFPGVDLGAQPERPEGLCPRCGAVLGCPVLPADGQRHHLPGECPLEAK